MAEGEQIAGLLADLQTITETARAGVIFKPDEMLEPGETRPAAILFVDIVGFTSLARNLSSELLTKVVDRTFRIFELTVRAQGGYCDKVMGDAALYVFAGNPNYPPVCEAALLAALKLSERVAQVNESLSETGVVIAIRQGVAFGEVTRQAIGAEHAQLTVIGEMVNQAQRLQASAYPGAIQTTKLVLEKAGEYFISEVVGRIELKGIGEVTVYSITGMERLPVQLRGMQRQMTPLIGRDQALRDALAQLREWCAIRYPPDAWDITQMSLPLQGRNRLMLVRGVSAVGKSRFAYELVERLKAGSAGILPAVEGSNASASACAQTKSASAGACSTNAAESWQDACPTIATTTAHCAEHANLSAFTAELAAVAGLSAVNLPQRWEALCAAAALVVSPEYARRQWQHLQLLAYVLNCKSIDTSAIAQASASSFAESCQLAICACCELAAHEAAGGAGIGSTGFQPVSTETGRQDACATATCTEAGATGKADRQDACSTNPVILIIEDLQWMGWLQDIIAGTLAHTCLPRPLIVIGTVRPEYRHATESLGEGAVRIIELQKLAREQGEMMIQALLPGLLLPDHILAELHEKAAGIPYFYEAFARMLVCNGLVAPVGGASLGSASISVHDSFSTCTEAGATAEVSGQEAKEGRQDSCPTASTWHLAANIATLDIPEDIQALMLGRLDQLDAELRELARRASVLGNSFDRNLLAAIEQHLGYDHAGHPEDELSALIMEKLLRRSESDRYFYEHMLLHEAAYRSLLSANRRLLHSLAADTLIKLHLPGGAGELELLEQLIFHLEHCGRYSEAFEQTCAQLLVKAHMLYLRDWDASLERASKLFYSAQGARREQDGSCVNKPVLMEHFQLSFVQAYRCARLADFEQCLKHAELAIKLADPVVDRHNLPRVYVLIGVVMFQCGNYAQAQQYYEQALSMFKQAGESTGSCRLTLNLGLLYFNLGRIDDALNCCREALAQATTQSSLQDEGSALTSLGTIYCDLGEMQESSECLSLALAKFRLLGNRMHEGVVLGAIGILWSYCGRLTEAHNCLALALQIAQELGDRPCEAERLEALSWVYLAQGNLSEAQLLCDQASRIYQELDIRRGLASCYFSHGCIDYERDNTAAAEASITQALEIATDLELPRLAGACQGRLALLLLKRGDLAQALEALTSSLLILKQLRHAYLLGLTYCGLAQYHLATARYGGQAKRTDSGYDLSGSATTPGAALASAVKALADASASLEQIKPDSLTGLGAEVRRTREAIIAFAEQYGLQECITGLMNAGAREEVE